MKAIELAPVCLFTYNRLKETIKTVEALKLNYLAPQSELFIFSDGAKDINCTEKVEAVRKYIRNISGFKTIIIHESFNNKGLANSIISGVSQIIEKYEKVIVLEDDLVTSSNFLNFMNQALDFYEDSAKIISISGYTLDLPSLNNYNKDYYLGFRASSWGWGTWLKKWDNIDWHVSDYSAFKRDYILQLNFFNIGSDMPRMLKHQMEGHIDSWAIRWCYHQFKHELITIFAAKSKVKHIGNGEDATNAVGAIKFDTPLDLGEQMNFNFYLELEFNEKITKEFKSKFSIKTRVLDKLKKIVKK